MTQTHDSPDVYPTDPARRLYPWQSTPSRLEQALEAANDDPTTREFVNMLCLLDGIYAHPEGRDEPWRETTIVVALRDKTWESTRATGDLLTLARRAGWELRSVGFGVRKQLVFQEAGSGE